MRAIDKETEHKLMMVHPENYGFGFTDLVHSNIVKIYLTHLPADAAKKRMEGILDAGGVIKEKAAILFDDALNELREMGMDTGSELMRREMDAYLRMVEGNKIAQRINDRFEQFLRDCQNALKG